MSVRAIRKKLYKAVSTLWGRPVPFPALAKLVDAYGGEGAAPEVLYLGDSVVERIAREDTDQRTIPEMLASELAADRSVLGLSHSAYHPGVYQALLQCLDQLRYRPRTVVIPINLRCFSPQWDLEPAYQFTREIEALEAFAVGRRGKITILSKRPSQRQYEEFDRVAVSYPDCPLTTVGQFRQLIKETPETDADEQLRRRLIFAFFYMNPLAEGHRKLNALKSAVQFLNQRGVQPLLYVTPINFETAASYLGAEFDTTVSRNVNLLASHLNTEAVFHDWSRSLDPSFFFHARLHTEHLRQNGRAWVAEHLSSAFASVR